MSEAHLLEHTLSSETVFKGVLLHVKKDAVLLPDQTTSFREFVVHPGAVVIVAELPNGNLLFERQFRYPVGQVFCELPAGKIDPGEETLLTAQRELLEETGYTAASWRKLGAFHPTIGYSNEVIEVFLAQDIQSTGAQQLDEGEFLDVIEMSLSDAKAAIKSGSLTDGKTISALSIYELCR